MIISRESDYAIRILRAIADGEKHNIGQLCESEFIPKQFAYKIIDKLQKEDLVYCTRGKYGGVTINCDLHQVTVHDVLKTIDNDCYFNACLTPGHLCPWKDDRGQCKVHNNLHNLQNHLDDTLKNLDLYTVMFED